MSGSARRLALILILMAASPAAAQDQGFDPLLFAGLFDSSVDDVQAQTTQLYRIPFALPLRSTRDGRVGLRLTFPISFTSVRVQGVSDLKPFVRKLGVASIVPGIELQMQAGDRLRLRPFAEAGIGKGNGGGKAEVLYGAGIRARVDESIGRVHLIVGGSAMHRKRGTDGGRNDGHSMFEGAVDSQAPLGFSIGGKQARGGVYTIVRGFTGLDLPRENQDPIALRSQFEAGFSFSTSPDFAIWKIKLPWLAVGYQFGEVLSGVRVYVQFPF